MVLNPEEPKDRFRLAVIGRKKMPKPEPSSKEWGFVDMVRKDAKAIRESLRGETYETKTRGRRHAEAARPCGEGVYRILRHGDHTHLAYVLEKLVPFADKRVLKAAARRLGLGFDVHDLHKIAKGRDFVRLVAGLVRIELEK